MDYQEYLSHNCRLLFGLFKNQIKVFVIPYVPCPDSHLRPLHVYIVDLGKVLNQFINVRPYGNSNLT